MSAIVNSISIKAIETIKNIFEVNEEYTGPGTVQVHPEFGFGIEQNIDNTDQYRLTMTVAIGTKEEVPFPYHVETAIRAVVELKGIPVEKHKDVLQTNCTAILFPYARANISMIMSCSGVAPYTLPVMNMDKLFRRENDRQECSDHAD